MGCLFGAFPNRPEFAQLCLSRSIGGHPQRGGTNLGVFVPIIWLALPKCETTNLGVFDLSHVALLNGAVQIRVGLELTEEFRAFLNLWFDKPMLCNQCLSRMFAKVVILQ